MKPRQYPAIILQRLAQLVARHALAVLVVSAIVTLSILIFLSSNFRVSTDLTSMISDRLHFRQLEKRLFAEFPDLTDTIVIVIKSETADASMEARDLLLRRIGKERGLIKGIYSPGAGPFFERNGLLYLEKADLEKFSDKMAEAQPFIGLISSDTNMRGLQGVLGKAIEYEGFNSGSDSRLSFLFGNLTTAFDRAASGKAYRMPWESMMFSDKEAAAQRLQIIVMQPDFDAADLTAAAAVIKKTRKIITETINDRPVDVKITGDVALAYDDYLTVMDSVGLATILSICLVAVLLIAGLGSVRLVVVSLVTLITGLVWTTGFAMLAVGSLNLISLTFAVLFVGLGIDYSIQYCLRYRELLQEGKSASDAVLITSSGVGRGLFLSCIATAAGFFAFLPTPYAGVAELGLISGVGIFISLILNLTLLPALLLLFPLKPRSKPYPQIMPSMQFTAKRPRFVVAVCAAVAIVAGILLPRLYFDYNPLNLYNRSSESIQAINDLFASSEMPVWTISLMAPDDKGARELASRISKLQQVKAAITIHDLVPDNQDKKLAIISDMALFSGGFGRLTKKNISYPEKIRALDNLEKILKSADRGDKKEITALLKAIGRFRIALSESANADAMINKLEAGLIDGLPGLMKRLDLSLKASHVRMADLPDEFRRQYVSAHGVYRVQVMPKEDLLDNAALERFVAAVKAVAPDATDAPVTIMETGNAVKSSFVTATVLAIVAVVFLLLVELRSLRTSAFILVPLVWAIVMTASVSVLFDYPLNYANVVVLPLLVGVGVHSGIMFMLRYIIEPPADGNMLKTSTVRAIFLSSVTMVISTGTLILSSHRGIASMGVLLTVCFLFLLIAILLLMPALIALYGQTSRSTGKCDE